MPAPDCREVRFELFNITPTLCHAYIENGLRNDGLAYTIQSKWDIHFQQL